MSHFTMVRTCIRDLECLKLALDNLQMEYEEGDLLVLNASGEVMPVSLLIPVGEIFGIGFQKQENEYQIVADWDCVEFFTGLEEEEVTNQITQCYAYHKLMKEKTRFLQKGFVMAREPEFTQENEVVVILQRY